MKRIYNTLDAAEFAKTLTIEDRINILIAAKKNVLVNRYMCHCICNAIEYKYNINVSYLTTSSNDIVKEIFPNLTRENAQMVCRKAKTTLPFMDEETSQYWLYREQRARITMFDWLISEEKKKLK